MDDCEIVKIPEFRSWLELLEYVKKEAEERAKKILEGGEESGLQ